MALTVNYNLGNHGWAELHMCLGRDRVSMTVSYLHDTLAELITAANLMLKGAPDAKVIAMDERENILFTSNQMMRYTSPLR